MPIEIDKPFFDESSKYNYIKHSLPITAEMLGVVPEDLEVISKTTLLTTSLHDEPDRVIATSGLDGIPHIHSDGRHEKDLWTQNGLLLMQERNTPGLRYVLLLFTPSNSATLFSFLIIPKGRVFRLHRAWHRRVKALKVIDKPPILAEGVLEKLVRNTIGYLRPKDKFKAYGVKARRGIILDGDPGNGKTMACRYLRRLCDSHKIATHTVTSAELTKAYGENYLGNLLGRAGVTFFDDIDISFLDRRKDGRMACALLTAMDGMNSDDHVIRIFTTNETIGGLDPAFTRPGRIDLHITFEKPGPDLRRRLAESWPAAVTDNIAIEDLVEWSRGWSFAELENVRSTLVSNYLTADAGWDLRRAFDEVEVCVIEQRPKRRIGFAPCEYPRAAQDVIFEPINNQVGS